MDKRELQKIIDQVSKKTGTKKSDLQSVSSLKDMSKLLGNMDKKSADKLKSVLNNPDATKKILNSKKAQDILNKLFSS